MRAIAVNGSPRKNWNTATLLEGTLKGCSDNGVETEMVHLYDHVYRGCISCFACKRIGGKNYVFGSCEVLLCLDTYQFEDYSKYFHTVFDPDAKAILRDPLALDEVTAVLRASQAAKTG